jgi:DNA polymerase-1
MRHHLTPKKGDVLYAHLARQFGGPPVQKQMANFWRLAGTDPIGWDYAAGDGITTLELWRHQIASRDAQPFDMSQVWRLESDLIRVISRIERRGMKIDLDRAKEVGDLLHAEVADLRAELPPDFNVRSPSQVRSYCESLGRTDWPMTAPSGRFPNGQPSFTEKWLETFPEGKRIVEVREATNLGNSFLNPLMTRHVFGGRVFPQLHATAQDEFGTISGRFSCSDPNMQQVPKHNKKLGKLFRSIFIPDPDMVLYEGDYSQCEPRLFAHYTQEESLIAGYSSDPPRDMHRVCADLMSVDRDTIAKRMNMGLLTGMQIKTFAGHMGWDEGHARQMFNTWMRTFP